VRRTTSRAESRVMSLMEASSSTLPSAPTCSGHALNCGRVGLCACVGESMHRERARGHRVRESMRECAHGSDRDRECAQNVYTSCPNTHTPCNQSHAVCMLATATHVKVHTHTHTWWSSTRSWSVSTHNKCVFRRPGHCERRVASQSVVSCLQFRLRFREIGQSREREGKRGREGVWHAVLRCSYPYLSFGTGLHIVCRLHTHKSFYIAMRICMSSCTHEYIYICVNIHLYI